MPMNFHLHLGTLTLMFLGHSLHDLAEAGLWETCLQRLLSSSEGELRVAIQLCFVSRWNQLSCPMLWNLEKGHPWRVSDICLHSPSLHQPSPGLLVCFSWTSVVMLSWFTVSLLILFKYQYTAPNIFFKVEIQASYIIFRHVSVSSKDIFSNDACKDFTCSALVYPFTFAPFT